MINRTDINERVSEWGLLESTVEKDYVLGWLLWGIGSDPELAGTWIFKGGTCLKKCFIETYRFSEDLDFTVINGGPVAPDVVRAAMERISAKVSDESGIRLGVEPMRFDKNSSEEQSRATLYYIGPRETPNPASIKLDLTSREQLVRTPVEKEIAHPYPDKPDPPGRIRCYMFEELFAEKIRAMGERARPRDLYDIINLFRRPEFRRDPATVREILGVKCTNKGIPLITFDTVNKPDILEELKSSWENMLAHQLPALPSLDDFWQELPNLFAWLETQVALPVQQSIRLAPNEDQDWSPPAAIRLWREHIPMETIRFAAANHLVVHIGYVKEDGEFTQRDIEPYSLRRTSEGNIVLHAVDLTRGDHRSFRIDRIRSVEVTTKSFQPRYAVEFSATVGYSVPSVAPRRSSSSPRTPAFGGTTYKIECPLCGKRFTRSTYSVQLNPHKDKSGFNCPCRFGSIV